MNHKESEHGFTLIEVIVTLAIAAIILVPLVQILYLNERAAAGLRADDRALFLAQSKMEELKSCTFDSLDNMGRTAFDSDSGYFYAVSVHSESDYLKRINVTIYYYGSQGEEKHLLLTGYKSKELNGD